MTTPVLSPSNSVPSSRSNREQSRAAWIFGGLLLFFWLYVILFGPDVISPQKFKMLGIVSALLVGFLAFFLLGSLEGDSGNSKIYGLRIRIGGGFLAAVGAILYWNNVSPVDKVSDAAQDIRNKLDSAASAEIDPRSRASTTIPVPNHVRDLASELAKADTAFTPLANTLNKKTLDPAEYLSVRRELAVKADLQPVSLPDGARLEKVSPDDAVIPMGKWKEFSVRAVDKDGNPLKGVKVVWQTPEGGTRAYVGTTDEKGVSTATQIYTFYRPGVFRQVAAFTRPDAPSGFADGATIGVIGEPVVFTYKHE